jgi:hypothetical protein
MRTGESKMKNSEFRTPLIQSAAVLGGVLVLFAIVASSEASSAGGGILAIIFGIGNLILFFIGMGFALLFSIAMLIAIFLAAVAMVDSEQAAKMYSDLKKNFALIALSLNKQCSGNNTSETSIVKEEYDRTKQEIVELQEKNLILQDNIKGLTCDNVLLQDVIDNLHGENSGLKEKIEVLMERLKTLESSLKPAQLSGIFTYIEKEEEQSLFIQKVQEALSQDMTYAQIDDYLIDNLPAKLLKTIKDHPVLTKNYIRSLRTD